MNRLAQGIGWAVILGAALFLVVWAEGSVIRAINAGPQSDVDVTERRLVCRTFGRDYLGRIVVVWDEPPENCAE